nr:proton-coupled amino acid transporter-like protein pathetic isoform X2 [Danaus plexippus plexippus]
MNETQTITSTQSVLRDIRTEITDNDAKEDVNRYVPAEHRPRESNTSFGALAHLLKASLSSGVLAMPVAFKNAGLITGIIGTIFVGLICVHVTHIFVKTSQALCVDIKRPCLGYSETCYSVFKNGPKSVQKFASIARFLADCSLAVTHLGACCVYIVVVAESFKQVSDEYCGPSWSVSAFCALTLIVLIPLTQITKLKYLVPFSTFANFVWLTSICISLYYCLRKSQPLSKRNLSTSFSGFVNFISTSLFAMEGIGVVMPIENEMLKPNQFLGCPGVLTIAMSAVVALFAFVGFTGYLSFGEDVRGSLTLNLPHDEILAQVAKILVACVMLLSYALIFYVPLEILWKRIKNKFHENNHRICVACIRLAGTVFTVGLACAIPRLELFMELVGAVCLSILGITFPVIIETVFLWDKDMGKWKWILWKNTFILIFSILVLISGISCSIQTLFQKL